MDVVVWAWAGVYVVGHLLLWHRVERERLMLPGDEYGDPEPITVRRPPDGALTEVGWRYWRIARRFSAIGFFGWIALVLIWFNL